MTTNRVDASHVPIARGLLTAGLILGISVALKLLSPAHLSPVLVSRLFGVLLGTVVVVYANAVPKALSPLIQLRCDAVAEQGLRRFAGWSLTLGGAAYAVVWLSAPLARANGLARILLGVAVSLVVVRLAWGMVRGARIR